MAWGSSNIASRAPVLTGGTAAAADAKVIGGVTVDGYAITAAQKTLTAGSGISITGAADEITIENTYSYTLPAASSVALGGVKSGTDITVDSNGNVSVNDDSHNHVISNIDNLQTTLDAKAPLASPAFTGVPTAPTAAAGTNTTQVATTAFVNTHVANALSGFSTKPFATGTTAPSNTNLLWIDITASNSPILKYHNGTSWVALSAVWGG